MLLDFIAVAHVDHVDERLHQRVLIRFHGQQHRHLVAAAQALHMPFQFRDVLEVLLATGRDQHIAPRMNLQRQLAEFLRRGRGSGRGGQINVLGFQTAHSDESEENDEGDVDETYDQLIRSQEYSLTNFVVDLPLQTFAQRRSRCFQNVLRARALQNPKSARAIRSCLQNENLPAASIAAAGLYKLFLTTLTTSNPFGKPSALQICATIML